MLDGVNATDSPAVILTGVASGIAGNLFAPSVTKAVLRLATARAEHVKHVPVSSADLYHYGVPLDEAQFRESFAAMRAELDVLPQAGERSEWDRKRQYAAVNRLSLLAGTFPQSFPMLGNADDAWNWYAQNNPNATAELPQRHGWRLLPPGIIET
jgi:hypothetical protein